MGTRVPVASRRSAQRGLMSSRPQEVTSWLAAKGERVNGPVVIRRIGAGQSNITSVVTDADGREWGDARTAAGHQAGERA